MEGLYHKLYTHYSDHRTLEEVEAGPAEDLEVLASLEVASGAGS